MFFTRFRGNTRPLLFSILVLMLVAQVCFGYPHYRHGLPDWSVDWLFDDDSDRDSKNKKSSKDDGPTQEEIEATARAEIAAETERVLADLATAAADVRDADREISQLLAAAAREGRADHYADLTGRVSGHVEEGRNSYRAISVFNTGAWAAQYSAAATRRSALERDLGISRTPRQGDPVRVFDGAYVTSLPLPILRYGQAAVDLSLDYDGNRAVRGTWGRGWTGITEERIITGSIRAPAIGSAITAALEDARSRHDAILALVRSVVPGVSDSADIVAAAVHSARLGGELRSVIATIAGISTNADNLKKRARSWGFPTRDLDRVIAEIRELRRAAEKDLETVRLVRPFLSDGNNAVRGSVGHVNGIREFERILRDAAEHWKATEEKNRSVLLPGTEPDAASIGTDRRVYVDRVGRRFLFQREDDQRYLSSALPHVVLIEKHEGWEMRSPDGEIRTFGRTGYIESVSSLNGGSVSFLRRDGTAESDIEVLDPTGRTVAHYRRVRTETGDATVTLSIPSLDDHRFTIGETGIVRADSPRGTVSFRYTGGRIVEISRGEDRTTIEYDPSDRVIAVTHPTGGEEEFDYPTETRRIYRDPDGITIETIYEGERLVEEIHRNGYRRKWIWEDGHIIEEADNQGRGRMFGYDSAGALRLEQFAAGSYTRLDRDEAGFPTRITTDAGVYWEAERDAAGRIVAIRTPTDNLRNSGYPGPAATVTVTNDRGGRWRISYDDRSNPIRIDRGDGRVEEFEFDVLGRIETHRINGTVVTRVEYTRDGRPSLVEENGQRTSFRYNDDPPRTVTTLIDGSTYSTTNLDGNGNVVKRTFYDGTVEEFVYTPGNAVVAYTNRSGVTFWYDRDGAGNLLRVNAPAIAGEWRFAYDETGRRTGQLFPNGSFIRSIYNGIGQAIGRQYPDGSVDLQERLAGGRVRYVSPSGKARLVAYDAVGRPYRIYDEEGEVARVEYDGHDERWTADGETIRTIVYDPYGRRIERTYPDGTSDRYRYGTGAFPVYRFDRRNGEETWLWDDFGRCVFHRDATGSEERWVYEAKRTRYIGPDGEETIVAFDLDGRPTTVSEDGGPSSFRYRPDGVLVVTDREGHEVARHFHPIRSSTGLGPFSPFLPSLPVAASGESAFVPSSIQRHQVSVAGRTYSVDLDTNGHLERITLGERSTIVCDIDPRGNPRSVADGGRVFSAVWGNDGELLQWTPPNGSTRTYRYDRLGALRSWRDALGEVRVDLDRVERTLRLHATEPQPATRSISFDPYGAVLRDEQTGPAGERTSVSMARDEAGRITAVSGSAAAAQLDASYAAAAPAIDVGIYHVRFEPRRNGTLGVRIDTDGAGRHTIAIGRDTCRYNDALTIVKTDDGSAKFLARRPSGVETTVDAYVSLFDAVGRRTLEHDLYGTVYGYRYDSSGQIDSISTNAPISSGPLWRTHGPAGTRISSRRELSRRWRSIDVARPPAVPLRLTEFNRISVDTEANTNPRGQIETVETTSIRYDPITDRAYEVASGDRTWRLVRGIDGAPIVFVDLAAGHRYSTLRYDAAVGGRRISIRYWERERVERDGAVGPKDTARNRGRYRPGGPVDSATDTASGARIVALEIRIDHVPIAYLDGGRLLVPFCDDRGSIRGLYDTAAGPGESAYSRCPETAPLLVMGTSGVPGPGRDGGLPEAIPYETVVAGIDRLRGTDVLLTDERVALPAIDSFNRPDPDLDGLEWYRFGNGDPINYVDVTGRFVVPAKTGHYQQDKRWKDTKLGSSSTITIGNAGCKLVTLSNAINQIADAEITDPGTLNSTLTDSHYIDDCLLSSNDAAKIMTDVTGHEVVYVAVEPEKVDIDRVIEAIAADPDTRYVVSARIQTHPVGDESGSSVYEHSLNVTGFDRDGRPQFRDTSRRNRTSLGASESIIRYDVYATSQCRAY